MENIEDSNKQGTKNLIVSKMPKFFRQNLSKVNPLFKVTKIINIVNEKSILWSRKQKK